MKMMNNRKMRIKMKAIKKKLIQYNQTIKMIKMKMEMKMRKNRKNNCDDCNILKIIMYLN